MKAAVKFITWFMCGVVGALVGMSLGSREVQPLLDQVDDLNRKLVHSHDEAFTLKNANSSLHAIISRKNSADFERRNGWRSAIGNCEDREDKLYCSALTEYEAPVSYHCDLNNCVVDCGVVK